MNRKALIVVDVQNDFCPGGALAVKDGDQVVEPINKMIQHACDKGWLIVFSRDWHPEKTKHFKQNPEDPNGWPAHCVRDTPGADFHPGLHRGGGIVVVSKGTQPDEDGYSAFDGKSEYGNTLEEILKMNRVTELYVGGLATDYCVKETVLDTLEKGYQVYVLEDACRAVNLKPNDGGDALDEMLIYGAALKTTEEVIREMDN
ncbi:MAG: bifunctional nicotinamidase/pyrazinamidase [Patescibacteria group bacterium]